MGDKRMFSQRSILLFLLILVWMFNFLVIMDIMGYIKFNGALVYPFSLAGVVYLISLRVKQSDISRGLFIFGLLSLGIMFSLVALGIYVA